MTERVPGGLSTGSSGLKRTKPLTVATKAVHNRNGFTRLAGTVSAHVQTGSDTEHRSPSPLAKMSTDRVPTPHLLRVRWMRK